MQKIYQYITVKKLLVDIFWKLNFSESMSPTVKIKKQNMSYQNLRALILSVCL